MPVGGDGADAVAGIRRVHHPVMQADAAQPPASRPTARTTMAPGRLGESTSTWAGSVTWAKARGPD